MKAFLMMVGGLFVATVLFVLVGALAFAGTYGGLNSGNQTVHAAFANIESETQRRLDLIPNIVQVVKGYAKHEHDTFVEVTEARSKVSQINLSPGMVKDPQALQAMANAQGELGSALSRLMVVAEKYPDLKANEQFRDLQSQLEGTENRINVARKRYNEAVQSYNTAVHGLLGQFVAGMFGFTDAEYYQADEKAKIAPKVQFVDDDSRKVAHDE